MSSYYTAVSPTADLFPPS